MPGFAAELSCRLFDPQPRLTWSAPSRATLPRERPELKIRETTSGLDDRRSRDQRNGEAKGNSFGVVRGPVENGESHRSISVHNRAEMGRRKFHMCEFFRNWRARKDSNLRPPA